MKYKVQCCLILIVVFQLLSASIHAQKAQFIIKSGSLLTIDGVYNEGEALSYGYGSRVFLNEGEHTFVCRRPRQLSVYKFTAFIKGGMEYEMYTNVMPLKLKEGGKVLDSVYFEKISMDKPKGNVYRFTNEKNESKFSRLTFSSRDNRDNNMYIKIFTVDGVWGSSLLGFNKQWNSEAEIILDPGIHTIEGQVMETLSQSLDYRKWRYGTKICKVTGFLEPGKSYRIIIEDFTSAIIEEY